MKPWKYPEEVAEYIADHVSGTTTRQLTADLNRKFSKKYDMQFTEQKVKCYKNNHKLKSGTKGGNPKGYSPVYPEGMRDFILSIAKGKTAKELTEEVNQKYGPGTITEKRMTAYKKNHNIISGVDCRFTKGHEPANKGKKMSEEQYEKCKSTMFKKGNIPENKMEVGMYTHTTDGYLIRKVQEHGKQRERFEFVHRAVWEKHNGPIPEGKMVSFLDGDKDNCDIENLFLIDNETNLEMNRNKLRFDNKDLTVVGARVAEVNVRIRNIRKTRKDI